MHPLKLRKICLQNNLDISNVKGRDGYLKILKENNMLDKIEPENKIITSVSAEDLKSLNISAEKIRIDKLKADMDALRVPIKIPRVGVRENRFGDRVQYYIDTNENTIRFTGGYLGPRLTTLSQPDSTILYLAKQYLNVFSFNAHEFPQLAGGGIDTRMNPYMM